MSAVPNGWFINDLVVFNELDTRGFVSKGYAVEAPDLRNVSSRLLDHWEDLCTGFLHSLHTELRCQLRWRVDSDYARDLLAYRQATERLDPAAWPRLVREERFNRYWNAMKRRQLRRERCSIWLSKPIKAKGAFRLGLKERTSGLEHIVAELAHEFSHHGSMLDACFSPGGARIVPMGDLDHFKAISSFLNPSFADRFNFDPGEHFDSAETLQMNCWHSDVQAAGPAGLAGFLTYLFNPGYEIPYGYFSDGYYHSILCLKKWPRETESGDIHFLTGLPFLDYEIVVNIHPLSTEDEIQREEALINRLDNDYREEKKHSLLTAIRSKDAKVQQLAAGHCRPFRVEFLIHAWDRNLENLQGKVGAIKQAVHGMKQAAYAEINVNTCVLNLWNHLWPGWTWSPYGHRTLYAQTPFLSNLLPLSATFTGHLDQAEALYDGDSGNLVGVRTFVSGTPQLAAAFGMTRAGKSAQICDLLSQTDPYFDYTVIVEEGLSYGIWTQAMGAQPIIIQADTNHTFNYLDANGLPLTSLQISTAAALLAAMVGLPADDDRQALRLAQITQYIDQCYTDAFEEWERSHESELPGIARFAKAVISYRENYLPANATFLEAWVEFRDLHQRLEPLAHELLDAVTEAQITEFLKGEASEKLMRNAAFAFFGRDHFPTHSDVQQLMRSPFRAHNREEIRAIATRAEPWCAHCAYGTLVDGPSTISLTGKIAHFELGYISEHDKRLKAIANFLVANFARQHIVSLPRHLTKRAIFEEVSRTLDVPGGAQLVAEFYAQLSKFSTWIVAIVQQYSRFKESRIRPVIMGNSKMFFFQRMNDRADLGDLCADIELPEVTRERIMHYPLPEHLPAGAKFSSATYYHMDADRPNCGTLRNVASPEMLYVSSSTGADFEKRARDLKNHATGNVVGAIRALARKDAAAPSASPAPVLS
jgi:hypothetical protein